MVSLADTPPQFIAGLESKFSQLSVSLDDPLLTATQAEQLPEYTPIDSFPQMPKAQNTEQRGRSRSLASRGILRHRSSSGRNGKTKSVHPATLMVQLKRRLHTQSQSELARDDMELDANGRKITARKSTVRAGVIVARRKRENPGDDGDVSSAEIGGASTPYARNGSALICWSRRRASSFGEQQTRTSLLETHNPTNSVTEAPNTSSSPLPNTRRRRSGRSASTSGLPLPQLDTTDSTVRRPSFALSLMKTPFIQDIDMASPMSATPIMRTSTESSMWGPRKLNRAVIHHGPIEEDSTKPTSPPPEYASVMHRDDEDGDADDEKTPLRTMPIRRAGSPTPASLLDTVHEEEETSPKSGDHDQDVMIL
ncbi:unnamed protein product [Rhizoctonia solani]|uniref:Uncharacterized protein n=3 Tax=Rhizoctonia solani TaxID=456999 RepID=A0A8H2X4K3_9AGAM|nr:cupin domain protein [Rhizoctonia solani AG-3 Rhs1AP]KEP52537.1 cupin domain protein [Rhizoctonia solani 123E]CAE6416323.1 unnamed protein product [Rhizoctonia solani]